MLLPFCHSWHSGSGSGDLALSTSWHLGSPHPHSGALFHHLEHREVGLVQSSSVREGWVPQAPPRRSPAGLSYCFLTGGRMAHPTGVFTYVCACVCLCVVRNSLQWPSLTFQNSFRLTLDPSPNFPSHSFHPQFNHMPLCLLS